MQTRERPRVRQASHGTKSPINCMVGGGEEVIPMTLYAINRCLWQLAMECDICNKNQDSAMAHEIERGFKQLVALKKRMEKEPDKGNCADSNGWGGVTQSDLENAFYPEEHYI